MKDFERNSDYPPNGPSYTVTKKGVLGIMYCGDKIMFDSVEDYLAAYKEEEDEIIEELERLYATNFVDYPDDFVA